MKRHLINTACSLLVALGALGTLYTQSAQAAPGEYWEITTKMEMAGMPMQMPTMTLKVCVPAGSEKNPQYMQKNDGKCQLSDVRTSGNKVSWKTTCVEHGETMTGTGESIHEGNSYRGKMHLSGKTQGQAIDMTQTYSGKKIGGACDSEDQVRAIQKKVDAAMGATCDTTNWISRSSLYLKGSTCPGKKEPLCAAVRRDAARNAQAYQTLIETEKHNNALITSSCGLDLESLRASVCKASKGGNYNFLKANCPAEAKAYLELSRKNCAGRSYTSRAAAGCAGDGGDDMNDAPAAASSAPSSRPSAESAEAQQHKAAETAPRTAADVDAVIEGAKKLKGLFGF